MFPTIEHISQLLPSIEGRQDFVVKRTPWYTAIDYVYVGKDTFDDPLRLECRGIKFHPDGTLMARPFHKFFNIGEELRPEEIDLSVPHIVMEKLDGSMVHPALLDDELVFMTRMGDTDIAKAAFSFAEKHDPMMLQFCRDALNKGFTPIFEYVSPDNRIVVRYEEPALILLAIRNTRTGEYLWDMGVGDMPTVSIDRRGISTDIHSFIDAVKGLKGKEGFVIRFENGLTLKMKADEYVLRHRAKSDIGLEKNALMVVLNGDQDDVIPLLHKDDAALLKDYAQQICEALDTYAAMIKFDLERGKDLSRKDFAINIVSKRALLFRPALYLALDGMEPREALIEILKKLCTSGPKIAEVREQLLLPKWGGAEWTSSTE